MASRYSAAPSGTYLPQVRPNVSSTSIGIGSKRVVSCNGKAQPSRLVASATSKSCSVHVDGFNGFNGFNGFDGFNGAIRNFSLSGDFNPVFNYDDSSTISVAILGASGNLAKKKLFPALFALYLKGHFPRHFTIFGYGRTEMTNEQLRSMIRPTLACKFEKRDGCEYKITQFLKRCFYQHGNYDSEEHFEGLDKMLKEHEGDRVANRLFHLSVPPNVFLDVARCTSTSAVSSKGWTRLIVEKPFGRDSKSSAELTNGFQQYFMEDQIFRIDHYLAKKVVKSFSALRRQGWALEDVWSNRYITDVQIVMSENFGTEGRGGYFDQYGIIRDVMQNHLLQMLAIVAIEPPASMNVQEVTNEKVKVLQCVRKPDLEDLVVGQYTSNMKGDPGYTDDPTVPANSTTPTFASITLFIDNSRWSGVPFIMKAGKALKETCAEIRVRFKYDLVLNELLVRVQPDGGIFLKLNDNLPTIDLSDRRPAPDPYESLLLDAIRCNRNLFIRNDELEAAWEIFTPLLEELEKRKVRPQVYPYGSLGPVEADKVSIGHIARRRPSFIKIDS